MEDNVFRTIACSVYFHIFKNLLKLCENFIDFLNFLLSVWLHSKGAFNFVFNND